MDANNVTPTEATDVSEGLALDGLEENEEFLYALRDITDKQYIFFV